MKKYATLLLVVAHTLLIGCASMPAFPAEQATTQHCPVCRCHRDFGCLIVEKKPSTPSAQYRGHRYWFCSETCRKDFQKSPLPYLPKS
jgi:YHS domain-containing protein